jgi:hypothetical protein
VSGDVVEQYLMPDEGAEPGSFSDFVWVFESATGRVVSASMSGTVRRTLDWGFFRSSVSTKIHVEMTSDAVAGFSKARRFLGQTLFDYCDPSERGCTQVLGRRYDPERGYVNAVGSIHVRSLGFRARAFSPLGEAIFSELPPPTETTLTEVSPGEQPTVHTLVAP